MPFCRPSISSIITRYLCLWAGSLLLAQCSPLAPDFGKTTNSSLEARDNSKLACAQVADVYLIGQQGSSEPQQVDVDPQLALACLTSIPVNVDDAKALLEYLRGIVGLQSNNVYIRDPSLGRGVTYRTPWDILEQLNQVETSLVDPSSPWNKQYFLEKQLVKIFNGAWDYHFSFTGAVFGGSKIQFEREPAARLVSASSDGLTPPKIFLAEELKEGSNDYVVEINGEPIDQFLETELTVSKPSLSDRNSRYQSMLHTPSLPYYNPGKFIIPSDFPGDRTELRFKSGVVKIARTLATILPSSGWAKIQQGTNPYDALVTGELDPADPNPPEADGDDDAGPSSSQNPNIFSEITPARGKTASGERSVHIRAFDSKNSLARRESDDKKFEFKFFVLPQGQEVAVMQLPSFEDASTDFGWALNYWVRQAKLKRTKRLIIDLQNNRGGRAVNMYYILSVLFNYFDLGEALARFRLSDSMRALLQYDAVFAATNGFPYPITTELVENAATRRPFQNWDELFKPYEVAGDQFSALFHKTPSTWQPDRKTASFKPEDVVVVSNGVCGSAAALLVELLSHSPTMRNRVKFVSVGGFPENGPSQVAGGIKGGAVVESPFLDDAISRLKQSDRVDAATKDALPVLPKLQIRARFNAYDTIRQGDSQQVPTQFIFDASHCRLYFTKEMLFDIVALYSRVYDAAWGDVTVTSQCCGLLDKCSCGVNEAICVPASYNPPTS